MRAPLSPTTSIQSRYAGHRLLAKARRAYPLDRQFAGTGSAGLDRRQGRDVLFSGERMRLRLVLRGLEVIRQDAEPDAERFENRPERGRARENRLDWADRR